MIKKIRHYFATGLLITLPIFFTLYLIYVVFRFIDGIWGKVINFYLNRNFGITVPGLGIILGIITVIIVGFITTNFFGKRIFHALEGWFLKFPFIRQIYPAAKQIVDSFISKESPAFKKVVLIEYPSKGLWSVGFMTNDSFTEAEKASGEGLMHVFVATTPSPLTGFLVLVPKRDVKFLDISVEQGVKLIVSAGIVKP
jgi:uncharacterized membrane protein